LLAEWEEEVVVAFLEADAVAAGVVAVAGAAAAVVVDNLDYHSNNL